MIDTYQKPLMNLEAEQSLLGCLLVDPMQFERVNEIIKSDFFFAPSHQKIYKEIERTIYSGKRPSVVLLKQSLDSQENAEYFADVGGVAQYLIDLSGSVISTFNTLDYANHLAELYLRRSASSKLQEYSQKLLSLYENISPDLILDEAESDIINFRRNADPGNAKDASDGFIEALKWMENIRNGKIQRTSTTFNKLDDLLSGFYPGFLYILAARPSMGKTAFALNIADNIAQTDPVMFFSLEMTTQELTMRLAARQTSISIDKQMMPEKMSEDEFRKVCEVKIPKKLRVDDRSGLSVEQIISRARAFARGVKPKLIIVDHLGLISFDRKINPVHGIGIITQKLKALAKDLDVPVILLCQLNRALELRDDKRPMLSDLRDSGAIEQDANVVMFLHREEYYTDKTPPKQKKKEDDDDFKKRCADFDAKIESLKGKADVIIAKNRSGKCGVIRLDFSGIKQEFWEN